MTIRSDYGIEINKVLAYLSTTIIATQDMIIEVTGVKSHNIRRMIHDQILTTSLNYDHHQGSFYGYKVHILIDAESEMPLGMIISSGEGHDSTYFIPLLEDFEKNYNF